ncbi:pilus assembly protein [Rhodobacteraceae bacterium W635]|uniref:pilus assembly protein n=1 Tax=Nioella halotolerans TaxID=2303578 RepID=UPI000E3B9883|nr:pilus assembly protein [Rhodobacteraceae bacterium W635]
MRVFAAISSFARSESGAVTVDWVVLTAALVGLGLAVTNTVSDGLESLSNEIRIQLESDHIVEDFN